MTLPTHRPPTHPGAILKLDFPDPLGLSQAEAARRLEIPLNRLNTIIKGHRSVSPDTAWRLADVFGTGPEVWMNLQVAWDLWHARQARRAAGQQLRPLRRRERQDDGGKRVTA